LIIKKIPTTKRKAVPLKFEKFLSLTHIAAFVLKRTKAAMWVK
jgi:hypothetical protein